MIDASRPNERAHSVSEITAVRSAPCMSSPAPSTRPAIGATPSSGKMSGVTTAIGIDTASPRPVSVTAAVA